MRQYEECIMGCPKGISATTHCFPTNPERRAEWCRILGVNPKQKRVCICGAHFNDCYKFGNRLSNFAVPNAPDSNQSITGKQGKRIRNLHLRLNNLIKEEQNQENSTESNTDFMISEPNTHVINIKEEFLSPSDRFQTSASEFEILKGGDSSTDNVLSPQALEENEDTKFTDQNTSNSSQNSYSRKCNLEDQMSFSSNNSNDAETKEFDDIKTGDFEIRERDTNKLIVQLRSIKTENSRMLSFVLPQKFALQQIIKRRDAECNRQLKQIKKLKYLNACLLKQIKLYRLAMFQWRHVKAINRYLNFKFKKFGQRLMKLKKKLKTSKREMKQWNEFCVVGLTP